MKMKGLLGAGISASSIAEFQVLVGKIRFSRSKETVNANGDIVVSSKIKKILFGYMALINVCSRGDFFVWSPFKTIQKVEKYIQYNKPILIGRNMPNALLPNNSMHPNNLENVIALLNQYGIGMLNFSNDELGRTQFSLSTRKKRCQRGHCLRKRSAERRKKYSAILKNTPALKIRLEEKLLFHLIT
jgi:hypothetical protein